MDGAGPFSTLVGTQFSIPAGTTAIYVNPTWGYSVSNNGDEERSFWVGFQYDHVPAKQLFSFLSSDTPAVVTAGTTGSGNEDATAITGTITATDVEGLTDGTVFSIASADAPANGTASINPASGAWSYTPNANFNGTDSFTVTITDDLNGTTPQVVTITVKYMPVIVTPGSEKSSQAKTFTTISSEELAKATSINQAYEFNEDVFSAINSKGLASNYNTPIEVSEGLTAETPLHIVFNLQQERQVLDIQEATAGGGTVSSNAPTNFDRTINGVYFNSSGGNDNLTGSDFNDFIRAGAGDDIINAGDGDDLVRGGSGSDRITLGAGRDIVYYTIDQLDGSTDTITDFNSAEDEIRWGDGIQIASRTSDQLVLQFNQDGIMRQTTVLFAATQPF